MKILLDTHAFLWADAEPDKLTERARAVCQDPSNALFLSAASVWEIQIKVGLGKLTTRKSLRSLLDDWVRENGLAILPVQLEHVLELDALPFHHKDPFDRLLVAQSLVEGCFLVTHDQLIAQYPVPIIW